MFRSHYGCEICVYFVRIRCIFVDFGSIDILKSVNDRSRAQINFIQTSAQIKLYLKSVKSF